MLCLHSELLVRFEKRCSSQRNTTAFLLDSTLRRFQSLETDIWRIQLRDNATGYSDATSNSKPTQDANLMTPGINKQIWAIKRERSNVRAGQTIRKVRTTFERITTSCQCSRCECQTSRGDSILLTPDQTNKNHSRSFLSLNLEQHILPESHNLTHQRSAKTW
jgi:hypothetical protein